MPGLFVALMAGLVLGASSGVFGAQERPNILFIMADDQAPWALKASGYPHAHTPNLDRVAREGMRFTHAFTPTPVCSPSRASLLTSRYGSELGITDWIHPKTDAGIGLDARFPTWPGVLAGAGYQTALIGKWHLGDLAEQHPTRRGYGFFTGLIGGGTTPLNPSYEREGVTAKRDGFVVELFAQEAVEWLRSRGGGTPFALSVHFREPHAAYLPVPDQDWAQVKDARLVVSAATNTPVRLLAAENTLRGAVLDAATLARCGDAAMAEVELAGDAHGSSAYKRELLRVHVQRALREIMV